MWMSRVSGDFGQCLGRVLTWWPAEVKAAVMARLREKVASLDEDRWMFEGEDEAAG